MAAAPDMLDVVVAAFTGLAAALSARAILMASVIGAFILAFLAMNTPHWWSVTVLIAYALLVVCPVAALEFYRRQS